MLCNVPIYRAIAVVLFVNDTPTTEIYTLSLHDALPISTMAVCWSHSRVTWAYGTNRPVDAAVVYADTRSEEHTSELQSRPHLVCRLLLEKKKKANGTSVRREHSPYVIAAANTEYWAACL